MNAGDAGLAFAWGLASGSGLLIGAVIGLYANLPRRAVALVMGFGSGILISVIAFDLMDEAFGHAGLLPVVGGFLGGAALFTVVSIALARAGGRHRKRSAHGPDGANARAIAVGSIMDNIPESIVIGLSLIDGKGVAIPTFVAVFLSNVPEALSSSAGMKAAGRKVSAVFRLWAVTMVLSGILALVGYLVFAGLSSTATALMQAVGARALLAMIADTMIPEAFEETHDAAGLVAAIGFLVGFALSHGLA
ncbi:MAG: ZIP family zinc transporter [Bauldia litoralis]|uniref:ZIP family metal transporter n=1 Tax=Bauldia litoralis TaxID=665467 RepID=UPI00329A2534